jgi:hypothetical protein
MKLSNILAGAVLAAGVALGLSAPADASIYVPAIDSAPTLIGTLDAGQTYTVTATGIANLFVGFNGGLGLTFTADGKPTYPFPSPYAAFYPNGLSYDPTGSSYPGTGGYSQGGASKLVGSLMGTYTATPTGPPAFFTIGLGTTITPTTTETLYAVVNDTFYPDNAGGYSVSVAGGVPEPAVWALMLLGVGGLGLALRQSRGSQIAVLG